VGELIPAERRGRFFGYCMLFGGIIAAAFAIIEGRSLDFIRSKGLLAFTGLFFFGAVFGLAAAALNVPQPDCPLPGGGQKPSFWRLVRGTFANRYLMVLAVVHASIAMSSIAGPFNAAYCLRDLKMSFFGLGLLNSVGTFAALLTSPWWGRIVDRFGARPVLILSLLLLAPCGLIWIFIPPGSARWGYMLLPWSNLVAGTGGSALGVALTTLMYKLSPPQGRSVQFAVYSVFVTLIGAPMPLVGGWLVTKLQAGGYPIDLRLTFYLWAAFIFVAAVLARFVREPQSVSTRVLVFSHLPGQVAELWGGLSATLRLPLLALPLIRRNTHRAGPGGQP